MALYEQSRVSSCASMYRHRLRGLSDMTCATVVTQRDASRSAVRLAPSQVIAAGEPAEGVATVAGHPERDTASLACHSVLPRARHCVPRCVASWLCGRYRELVGGCRAQVAPGHYTQYVFCLASSGAGPIMKRVCGSAGRATRGNRGSDVYIRGERRIPCTRSL
jgi:hypothetical protein